jgi:hypothetical protein
MVVVETTGVITIGLILAELLLFSSFTSFFPHPEKKNIVINPKTTKINFLLFNILFIIFKLNNDLLERNNLLQSK